MWKALGLEDRWSAGILAAAILLVALTPLGNEATQSFVFFSYRTLLFIVVVCCSVQVYRSGEPLPCPVFLGLAAAVAVLMRVSSIANPGSSFTGFYYWYAHVLFGTAFIALAAYNRLQSLRWKEAIIWAIAAIDVLYLTADLAIGRRPVIGPFVNPNYFASFLLVGFCIGVSAFLFHRIFAVRMLAAAISLYLYYGMTQAFSRGATIAAIGVVVLAALRFGRRQSISWSRIGIVLAILLVFSAIASPVLVQKFLDRGEGDPYNYLRPQVWRSTLQMIAERPVLGFGLGEYIYASKRFVTPVEGVLARYLKRPGIAHSVYLQYGAEIGLPATVLLFALAGYLVSIALRRSRTCRIEMRFIQEAAILTAIGLGAHGLVDNNWTVPVMAAGLIVFSLADCLPTRPWSYEFHWPARTLTAGAMIIGTGLYLHSTLIPALGFYFNEAGHRAYEDRNLPEAEAMHRIAAAIVPDQTVFLDNTGLVYLERYSESEDKQFLDMAESYFARAMRSNPNADDPRRHMETLLIQKLSGNVNADRRIHRRIVEIDLDLLRIDPFNPFVRKNLAEALYTTGSRTEAERELTLSTKVEPNYVPAYLRLAEWSEEKGNRDEAGAYRKKAQAVIAKYEHKPLTERYEALLLGRPDPYVNGQAVRQ